MYGSPLFWRVTSHQPKFFGMDARMCVVFLPLILRMSMETLAFAVISFAVYGLLMSQNIQLGATVRYVRHLLSGRRIYQRGFHMRRLAVDYGFEDDAHLAKWAAHFKNRNTQIQNDIEKASK